MYIIDVFLVHRQLEKHFTVTDYVSATRDELFGSHGTNGDIALLEFVSSHFLLTCNYEWTFNRFIYSLSWTSEIDNVIPEVCAPSLSDLLASRCIGIQGQQISNQMMK